MLEVRLLGQFELRLDGAIILLPSRRAQSLLAYLALSAGTAHRREKLAGLLWPDTDEDNARNSLRQALWRIRKAIEPDQNAAPYLLTDELAVSFNAGADYWLDAPILTRNGESLQDQLDALAVYRGELLPGFYDDWVTLERGRLEALFQQRMQRLLDRLVEERRWRDVLEWGERWVALGHTPEPGYRALMLAHAELGDRSRVAAVYQRCREALFNDLGVEPSIQTRRLYERLRRDELEPTGVSIAAAPPSLVENEPPAPGESPFQGLPYFDEADADRFFGREHLTARLVARLRMEPFLAVVGASGSGKSSVVRAGLVPALRAAAPDAGNSRSADRLDCEPRVFTPTAHPLEALAASLVPDHGGPGGDRAALLDELARDPHGLRRFLQLQLQLELQPQVQLNQRGRPARPVLLVVDQFEELFTQCQDRFEREVFADNLLAAAESDGPARVVIALRADFYPHCAEYARLREAVAQHQEYAGPLSPADLRRAIEGPAERGNWELEPGLVDLLLRDIGEEPGALPLLSHALLETWQLRRGRRLTLAGYAEAGGVQGAIAMTAETVFTRRLTLEQQAIARRLFLRLTELGDATQDTRRRAGMTELVGHPDAAQAVRGVLEILAAARLVTLGEDTAEVAHEALIREWPRLREWLNQDRERLQLQRQLERAALEWDRSGADASMLYRGTRLTQARDWVRELHDELSPLSVAFLDASREAAQREVMEREAQQERELKAAQQLIEAERRRANEQHQAARQLRQRAIWLAGALVMAVATAAAAVFFEDQAHQQATRAEASARVALSRELAAAAISNLSIDPERAGLLSLQAVATTYASDETWTGEAENALHRVLPLMRAQVTLTGHTGEVWGVAFSPDGRWLATASQDMTAKVWDATTGREQFTLRGHADSVNAVAFSPDGRLVATGSGDQTAKVWDARTGLDRLTLAGNGKVTGLAFSPDGARLATTGSRGAVTVWDPTDGATLLSFQEGGPGQLDYPFGVAFSPDGARLATATLEGSAREWAVSSDQPRLLRTWPSHDFRGKHSVAFSPDGTQVAVTVINDTVERVRVWSTATGGRGASAFGHANQVYAVAFSPDGGRFATGSLDRTAKVWDTSSGHELLTLAGHQGAVNDVTFSPDGQRLATASWDHTATVWDLGLAHEALAVPWDGSGRIAVSPDGNRLLAGFADGTGRVWDARTGQELLTLQGHVGQVWGTAISADASRLATGGADTTVRIWSAANGEMLHTLTGHGDTVYGVAFSPDGTRLVSASADATAKVWNVVTGQQLLTFSGHSAALWAVAFTPDGARVATVSQGPESAARIWDASSGQLLVTLTGHQDSLYGVGLSPDGRRLVTASRDGTARVWDATSGQQLILLRGHAGTVVGAAYSPDGQRIVTGGKDGGVKLWEASTGKELLTLTGDVIGGFGNVVFDQDGRRVFAGGGGALHVYVLPIEDVMTLVRARLTRSWTLDECRVFLHQDQCPE